LTALSGGAAFAALEEGRSTWDDVWWAVTTMTTVGYGDMYPATTAGRAMAMVVMLVGIGSIAVLTGVVAERFLSPQVETGGARGMIEGMPVRPQPAVLLVLLVLAFAFVPAGPAKQASESASRGKIIFVNVEQGEVW
jgi:hypothetical protein